MGGQGSLGWCLAVVLVAGGLALLATLVRGVRARRDAPPAWVRAIPAEAFRYPGATGVFSQSVHGRRLSAGGTSSGGFASDDAPEVVVGYYRALVAAQPAGELPRAWDGAVLSWFSWTIPMGGTASRTIRVARARATDQPPQPHGPHLVPDGEATILATLAQDLPWPPQPVPLPAPMPWARPDADGLLPPPWPNMGFGYSRAAPPTTRTYIEVVDSWAPTPAWWAALVPRRR